MCHRQRGPYRKGEIHTSRADPGDVASLRSGGNLERLTLAGLPEISAHAVRAELTWPGIDRAVQLFGGLLLDAVDAIALEPTSAGPSSSISTIRSPSGGRARSSSAPIRDALSVGIARAGADDALGSLAALDGEGAGRRSAEVPARFRRAGHEHDGVLTLMGPSGTRPVRAPLATANGSDDLLHPALHAHELWARGDSLSATLRWADVYAWVDRLLDEGGTGARSSVVDQQRRHFTLELSSDLRPTQITSEGGETTCLLSPADAATAARVPSGGPAAGGISRGPRGFRARERGLPDDRRPVRSLSSHRSTPRRAARAACQPHIAWTPPPGGVDDEHTRMRRSGVVYGTRRAAGRAHNCRKSAAPPLMSPPT